MTAESPLGSPRSLYLHLPFCSRRCPYCDFAIVVAGESLKERYLEALLAEIAWIGSTGAADAPLRTLYLGGGTPSLLGVSRLGRLLEAVHRHLPIEPGSEVTLEANPEQVDLESARAWHELGVNRVSLGVQSLDDHTLAALGREHDGEAAERAVAVLRQSQISRLSCDLIYAIPAQPTPVFARGLGRLLAHRPDHVSCYELTVEPRTQLERRVAAGREAAPSELESLEQGRVALAMLAAAGLSRYEVSNYCRPGAESRHNLNYWTGGAYLAAGCGAHGFLGPGAAGALGLVGEGAAVRYWHLRAAATYARAASGPGRGIRGREWLTGSQLELERLALGLRLAAGVELSDPRRLAVARELAHSGWLALEGSRVRATPKGVEVLDRVTLELAAA